MAAGEEHPEQGGVGVLAPAVPGPRTEASWRLALARFGYRAPERATVAELLVPPMPDGPGVTPDHVEPSPLLARMGIALPAGLWAWLYRWQGWIGPIAVALFGGLLRFVSLGQPNAVIFDETYYAKDAYSLWHGGYETNWPEDANNKLLASPQVIPYKPDPAYIVHPPVGKWIIGLGEQLFGMHPFGWRFMTALLGTVSILLIARIGRRLFRSTLLGCVAGLLLSVDGLHFVMSRAALLDLVVMFWFLAGFGFMLLDRDRTRALMARRLGQEPNIGGGLLRSRPYGMTMDEYSLQLLNRDWARRLTRRMPQPGAGERFSLGWRPYRLAAAACLGLMCATKWSGMYGLVAFALLGVCWDSGARKLIGQRNWLLYGVLDFLFLTGPVMLVIATAVYIASWTGWFLSSTAPGKGGYGRDWALTRHGLSPDHLGSLKLPQFDLSWVPAGLRSLWHYHATMYDFHIHLTSPHTYQSNPWSWLVLGRPVSFFYESPKAGQQGCHATDCAREVLAIGTPFLWWAGVIALAYCLYRWVLRRDWRAGAVLCGLAAGYLPWFQYQQRTIFLFYAVAFVPFLVLAVTMMIGALLGPADAPRERRLLGVSAAGLLVVAIMWNFAFFYPLYTGQTIPMDDWRARMWFTSWI